MPLDRPSHLNSLATSRPAVKHRWDAGDDMVAHGSETPAMLKNVGALSFRAVLGLQASLNEWVAQRFQHLKDDPELAHLIEAVWAASIDIRYLKQAALKFSAANGSVEGPMLESKALSLHICSMFEDAEFGAVRYVIASANLVKYVLPDSKEFQAWFKTVVPRVAALSQPSARAAGALDIEDVKAARGTMSADVFGSPVPREAFDPAFDLSKADPAALIDAMLVRIASQPNPYLFSAQEMTQSGFAGSPYRYPA